MTDGQGLQILSIPVCFIHEDFVLMITRKSKDSKFKNS